MFWRKKKEDPKIEVGMVYCNYTTNLEVGVVKAVLPNAVVYDLYSENKLCFVGIVRTREEFLYRYIIDSPLCSAKEYFENIILLPSDAECYPQVSHVYRHRSEIDWFAVVTETEGDAVVYNQFSNNECKARNKVRDVQKFAELYVLRTICGAEFFMKYVEVTKSQRELETKIVDQTADLANAASAIIELQNEVKKLEGEK